MLRFKWSLVGFVSVLSVLVSSSAFAQKSTRDCKAKVWDISQAKSLKPTKNKMYMNQQIGKACKKNKDSAKKAFTTVRKLFTKAKKGKSNTAVFLNTGKGKGKAKGKGKPKGGYKVLFNKNGKGKGKGKGKGAITGKGFAKLQTPAQVCHKAVMGLLHINRFRYPISKLTRLEQFNRAWSSCAEAKNTVRDAFRVYNKDPKKIVEKFKKIPARGTVICDPVAEKQPHQVKLDKAGKDKNVYFMDEKSGNYNLLVRAKGKVQTTLNFQMDKGYITAAKTETPELFCEVDKLISKKVERIRMADLCVRTTDLLTSVGAKDGRGHFSLQIRFQENKVDRLSRACSFGP